jgi:hypothetical protein
MSETGWEAELWVATVGWPVLTPGGRSEGLPFEWEVPALTIRTTPLKRRR